jgi:2,4-dienoyl-CoA reductase-like NADH-dependent reductase (Old Yellow Enzyme family)
MTSANLPRGHLFRSLTLPCGIVLKNRIAKSAMSDSLGDGCGNPTARQIRLYERWAEGGAALSIVGEVQCSPYFAERPGNLVLGPTSDFDGLKELTRRGSHNGTHLWAQLGHAGAMAYPPISEPKGPSAIDMPGLQCGALTSQEIQAVPMAFANAARLAMEVGFGGVEIHAAHGFLLSQFLSPLFNRRIDGYGGSSQARMRLLMEVVEAVSSVAGSRFPIGVKLNASDQLEGGLTEADALEVIAALDRTRIDLIDISGGTYFPGAKSSSDRRGGGPYFTEFARQARSITGKPLMVTGGFKTIQQAADALAGGAADMIGFARALALDPGLPGKWHAEEASPAFPSFDASPEGGITAWYTMRLNALSKDRDTAEIGDPYTALDTYNTRDMTRVEKWNNTLR